jgi:hypothetical protein
MADLARWARGGWVRYPCFYTHPSVTILLRVRLELKGGGVRNIDYDQHDDHEVDGSFMGPQKLCARREFRKT